MGLIREPAGVDFVIAMICVGIFRKNQEGVNMCVFRSCVQAADCACEHRSAKKAEKLGFKLKFKRYGNEIF